METLSGHRSPAVLMKNHGVFTIGPSAKAAVKSAVMCEDVAPHGAHCSADRSATADCPVGCRRLMAEGYGFGGEGDWKTSIILHTIRPWDRTRLAALRS